MIRQKLAAFQAFWWRAWKAKSADFCGFRLAFHAFQTKIEIQKVEPLSHFPSIFLFLLGKDRKKEQGANFSTTYGSLTFQSFQWRISNGAPENSKRLHFVTVDHIDMPARARRLVRFIQPRIRRDRHDLCRAGRALLCGSVPHDPRLTSRNTTRAFSAGTRERAQ